MSDAHAADVQTADPVEILRQFVAERALIDDILAEANVELQHLRDLNNVLRAKVARFHPEMVNPATFSDVQKAFLGMLDRFERNLAFEYRLSRVIGERHTAVLRQLEELLEVRDG